MIAPLTLEHVEQVAKLHCATLTGLLSELGEAAARAFYAGCVASEAAVGFVDVRDGEVRGFVLGSVHPDALKRAVAKNNPSATFAGIVLGVLRRPDALISLLKNVRGPDEGSYDVREPELTYLSVSPERREDGVGRSLADAFTRAMRGAGVQTYALSVDDDNAAAIAFYEKLGFDPIGRYREFGRLHRRYRLHI